VEENEHRILAIETGWLTNTMASPEDRRSKMKTSHWIYITQRHWYERYKDEDYLIVPEI